MHTERISRAQTATALKCSAPLLTILLMLIAVSLINSKTTNERIVQISVAACVVMTWISRAFIASKFSASRYNLMPYLVPATFLFAVSFTGISPIATPLAIIFALPVCLYSLVRSPKWLALSLIISSVLFGFAGTELLQPSPPPFAGVYEIHIPGAEGLRWDLDLYTNLFGYFDDVPGITVDGSNWPIQKPKGEYRILWVGDSQSLGPGLSREKTAAHIMGHRLREHYTDIDIKTINAGIYGADDLMQWLYFDQVLSRLDPDIVLVGWSGRIVPPFGSRIVYPRILEILSDCLNCDGTVLAKRIRYGSANPFLAGFRKIFHESKFVRNIRLTRGLGLPKHPEFIPQSINNIDSIPQPSREEIILYYLGHMRKNGYQLLFAPEINDSLDHFEKSYAQILQNFAPEFYIDVRPAFTGYSVGEIFADSAHFREFGHRLLGEFLADELIRRGIVAKH